MVIKVHVKKIFTRSTTVAVAVANLLGFYRETLCVRAALDVGWCLSFCLSDTLMHCIQVA